MPTHRSLPAGTARLRLGPAGRGGGARRPSCLASGLAISLLLVAGGAGPAGCDKPCKRFCKKMESCLSPRQKKRFFASRAQCEKNCRAWDMEDAADRCLDKAEGSCFRMMKCMGPAIQAGIRKRALQRQRLRRRRGQR